MPSNHLVLCCPFLLLPSIFPSIRVFSNESVLHIRWPKYWSFSFSFSFSIGPSNEYSGLIFFRIDWFDLFAVQGTLQESSPTPQFKSISSLVLSLLYGPTLTSITLSTKVRLVKAMVFPVNQFLTSGGQSIGTSASASVLPMNIQDWFPLGLTGWNSLQSKGLFKSLLQHHSSKASILQC